jgi:hypothetical protein
MLAMGGLFATAQGQTTNVNKASVTVNTNLALIPSQTNFFAANSNLLNGAIGPIASDAIFGAAGMG